VLGLAPPLADELARRADLLDPLIDASAFDLPGSRYELEAAFVQGVPPDDYERLLDSVRRKVGEQRFALGVQLVTGAHDPLLIGAALARIAEGALAVLARAAIRQFMLVHGTVPGSDLVVLGLGRLGGGMLTHASDLDLVFLFSGDHGGESDGHRPLGATLYFNRLAQRVSAALSVPTAEGALYEVDTRLRPSGSKGPLAVTLDSFATYQRSAAWTWEHMALSRARPLFGPDPAQQALRQTITEVLCQPREPIKLRDDLLQMRGDMAQHKPDRGQLDVKLMRGGLVDIEFIVHFLQLRDHQGLDPSLPGALAQLVAAGLLDPALIAAEALQSRFLIAARLLAPDLSQPPPAARVVLAQACQCRDWDGLLADLAESRRTVAAAWAAIFGIALELEP
jgi:[glutamine synthetase] adenylyltransferase / [glutamine synthetase]-adenylyl-L-tyrosine phosphorylase